MPANTLGETIKRLREARGWSQEQLSGKSSVSRSLIGMIETGQRKKPGGYRLAQLAYALDVSPEELYKAAGYDTDIKKRRHVETAEELLERARLASPISIPVYGKFHAGAEHDEPIEHVYWSRTRGAGKNIEAYRVHGQCMETKVSDGDIVIIDRDLPGEPGKIILCLVRGELVVGKLETKDNEILVRNNEEVVKLQECQASAVVIEVIKRLG